MSTAASESRRPPARPRTGLQRSPVEAAAWLADLQALRTEFGPDATRRKLTLLTAPDPPAFADADQLVEYHDALLFVRAYPDTPAVLRAAERRLRAFPVDVARYRAASTDASCAALADSGVVGSACSHVFSFRLARALAVLHPRAVDIDWEAYYQSDTANIPIALVPAMLWHETDAVDNDDAFDEKAWLERGRTRRDPTTLAVLLRLFAGSGLPETVQEHLYDQAEIPVRWDLGTSEACRTWKRIAPAPDFLQTEPLRGRSPDLRMALAAPPAPLRRVSGGDAERYVADVREVLASRVRELYPLAGASTEEVYAYEPGRGLQIVIYGSTPAIRLPHESNMGTMFVRNGVPVGYGLAAIVFDQAEVAINIFPSYRTGESAHLIEEFFRLCVHHFGARQLVVSSYQVGDGNDEGLDSGSFWFYYKLGFRPVRAAVADLARREVARIAARPGYRSSRPMLKRLAKSPLFFHLDAARMNRYEGIGLADLAYALSRHVVDRYGGDRMAAVDGAIQRLSRILPLADVRRWSDGEQLGARRLAPLLDALPGVAGWPRDDRALLARLLRAKGGRRERDFVLLMHRLPRLQAALRRLARDEARRRAVSPSGHARG